MLMLNEKKEVGICPKLQPVFKGPYVVTKKLTDWEVEIQLEKTGKKRLTCIDKLKQYQGNRVPGWMTEMASKIKVHSPCIGHVKGTNK